MTSSRNPAHAAIAMSRRFPPDPWQRLVAVGTRAVRVHAVLLHVKAPALDERRVAVVAARVLPLADLAGEVAGIKIFQARLQAELDDAHQVFDRRVAVAV